MKQSMIEWEQQEELIEALERIASALESPMVPHPDRRNVWVRESTLR